MAQVTYVTHVAPIKQATRAKLEARKQERLASKRALVEATRRSEANLREQKNRDVESKHDSVRRREAEDQDRLQRLREDDYGKFLDKVSQSKETVNKIRESARKTKARLAAERIRNGQRTDAAMELLAAREQALIMEQKRSTVQQVRRRRVGVASGGAVANRP